jgi:hypothetical protein
MKKVIIIVLALFLALPAISLAGTATSRWDLTIGGFVKFDMGIADQGVGADYTTAQRASYLGNENIDDKYGNFYTAAGETRLNFLVKGPEGWGAKTSAFIEGDFKGMNVTNGGEYGFFDLRHAYMKFDWPNTTLIAGQTWQRWGYLPTYTGINLGTNDVNPFLRGQRQPQLTVEQRFNKSWSASLGLYASANNLGTVGGESRVNSFTRSGMPFIESEIVFKSDACGKIGPWQMLFGLGGFFGKEKQTYNIGGATTQSWRDKDVNAWGIALKGFIPIIPEKKQSKAGALSVSGNIFTGQNLSWFASSFSNSYARGSVAYRDYVAPVVTGGRIQIQYFFTNKLFATGWYGYGRVNFSQPYMVSTAINTTTVQNIRHTIINLSYDLNDAIRLGAEYANISTRYAGWQYNTGTTGPVLDKQGSFNAFRIGAFYFF